VPRLSEGVVHLRGVPVRTRARLALRRHVPLHTRRALKRRLVRLRRGWSPPPASLPATSATTAFQAGDAVRVRSGEEIEKTLDVFLEFKGCGFLPEMAAYCGTVQRICKPVQRFVDERDYKVKTVRGLYLLEGVMCEGTELFGRCDRGCLYFWREEWLEPVASAPQ
jgi:hypothetical protein